MQTRTRPRRTLVSSYAAAAVFTRAGVAGGGCRGSGHRGRPDARHCPRPWRDAGAARAVARRATVSVDGDGDGMPPWARRAGGVARGAVGAHCIGYLCSLPVGQIA